MSFPDRIGRALQALVREMLSPDASDDVPAWAYFATWELQVDTVTNTAFTGRPTSSRCPLPNPITIPLMPGVAGTVMRPAQGSLVGVAFLNGDPTRPRVVAWDQTTPVNVGLAGGGAAVHRVGDAGLAGTLAPIPFGGAGLLYTGPDGTSWIAILTCASPGSPGVWSFTPVVGDAGKLTTEATTGSNIVNSG